MIRVTDLEFAVGTFRLGPLSLEVERGDYFVLLGPTGMGKTLFIESLCGLLRPKAGQIVIDDRDVTALPPRRRGVGYVPQQQGLFPHLTVGGNIAFPLRVRRLSERQRAERLDPLVELLGIEHLLERWPGTLSGGERQKAALARALATRPSLLLLDEPVSALDEPSRERLCAELRRIHQQLRVTTLHVSHNLEEAFSVADRAGVIHEGRLVQTGPIDRLLREPASEFVARFFRTENIFRATATPDEDSHSSTLSFDGLSISVSGRHTGTVTLAIRPEAVEVHAADSQLANGVPAVLRRVSDRGPYRRLEFEAGRVTLIAYAGRPTEVLRKAIGERRLLALPAEAIHILP